MTILGDLGGLMVGSSSKQGEGRVGDPLRATATED
jgi:hypothetical protein